MQKQRARQKGVSAASLALGKKVDKAEEITDVSSATATASLHSVCIVANPPEFFVIIRKSKLESIPIFRIIDFVSEY